ncbi:uncharacterized protein BDV17DRAFT_280973 [Aspergillus undulatus]|uniref:uncharacterized protein n=1 Tax=Aspergillus undulatus TaxID=1810928 RepID=UPI003CCC98C4
MLATTPHCAPPGANGFDGFALPPMKRKRSNSSDSTPAREAPVATKLRTDDAPAKQTSFQQPPHAPPATKDDAGIMPTEPLADQTSERAQLSPPSKCDQGNSDPSAPSRDQKVAARKVDVGKLRETLEAQLSLEVLLKHNELRLIDQEIAKCQVALEQLRRCAEIPYPGSQTAGPSQSVSNGTGMSVWAPGNGPASVSPAPWGVVNGPYTRHYSRWLLPDPRFDGGEVEPATPMGFGATTPMEGRSTRGNPIDTAYLAGKSTRPSRGSTGTKLQSLPSGYPAPKERAGPMIIRRKSDGVLVKLVCLDCRRDNFSSTQGFINHCRIAHNRNFASHDAAAVASGEPIEVDDAGAVVGGKNEPSTAAVTPGFVHPLIRSAHAIESTPRTPSTSEPSKRSSKQSSPTVETPGPAPSGPKTPNVKVSNDAFTASDDTPHLSSLMKLKGVGLDLGQLVGDAKTTVDLDDYSSEEGESESEPVTPSTAARPNKPLAAGRQPMRTTASQTASERPDGHKGVERPSKPPVLQTLTPTRPPVPYQSPYAPTGPRVNEELREVDLSPNTVESNQAPSLVSDDDDFEAASDSDSPGPCSSEPEDGDDFSLIDVEDDDATRSTTTSDPKDVGLGSAAKPLKHGNMKKGQYISPSVVPINRGKDEKRVSFVNLSPRTITLSTFTTLLTQYDSTVKRISASKALSNSNTKARFKNGKSKSKKNRKRAADAAEDADEDEDSLSSDTQNQIAVQVRQFQDLDEWRYGILPEILRDRREGREEEGNREGAESGYLSKDEALKLMEWKLKHGMNRPTLMGILKSNREQTLEKLTVPVRGVGPATASLILSIAEPYRVPFHSDDVYLWLCVGVYPEPCSGPSENKAMARKDGAKPSKGVRPNGVLNVKYNLPEYRRLWGVVRRLRDRLNAEARREGAQEVSCVDVEKVALVVRHYQIGRAGEIDEPTSEEGENEHEGKRKKRKKVDH